MLIQAETGWQIINLFLQLSTGQSSLPVRFKRNKTEMVLRALQWEQSIFQACSSSWIPEQSSPWKQPKHGVDQEAKVANIIIRDFMVVVHLPLSLLPPPNLSLLPPLIWRFCSHQRALLPPLICIICPPIIFSFSEDKCSNWKVKVGSLRRVKDNFVTLFW